MIHCSDLEQTICDGIGMALAVIATIFGGAGPYGLLAPMVIIGGGVGAWVAGRVQMSRMPELVDPPGISRGR